MAEKEGDMKQLFLPDELEADLERLLGLEDSALSTIAELLDSETAGRSTADLIEAVTDRTGLAPFPVFRAIQIVRYLSEEKSESALSDDAFFEQLERAYPKFARDLSSRRETFAALFADKPKGELARKKVRLSEGIVKTLKSVRGVCDVRPIFDAKRHEIVDQVQVVLARFVIADDRGDDETLVLQLNESSLEKLSKFLEVTKRKLEAMEKRFSSKGASDAT